MYTLAYFTTLVAAWTATSVRAVPLNHEAHHKLHHALPRVRDVSPNVIKLAPLEARAPLPVNISPVGQCGGDSGYGCASTMCCSKWGYCGTGDDYCGSSGSNSTSSASISAAAWSSGTAYTYSTTVSAAAWSSSSSASYSAAATSTSAAAAYTTPAAYTPSAYTSPAGYTTSTAASASTSAAAAPSASASASSGGSGMGNVYTFYTGSGSTSAGWPSMSEWASFDDLWSANEPTIAISCTQFGQTNPSTTEIADLKAALLSVSESAGVDARFSLAIMMQESKGCVRVPTTSYSHSNPGLFQSYEGTGTCNPSGTGTVPCPQSEILQMVKDGVSGTTSGPGLEQDMKTCEAEGSQLYYETARIYNAGSLVDGNLDAPGATECYCTDVANRLTGWTTAETKCTLS